MLHSVNFRRSGSSSSEDETVAEGDMLVEACTICYTNEIQIGSRPITDEMTVEFDCKHRFCLECSREMLRQ